MPLSTTRRKNTVLVDEGYYFEDTLPKDASTHPVSVIPETRSGEDDSVTRRRDVRVSVDVTVVGRLTLACLSTASHTCPIWNVPLARPRREKDTQCLMFDQHTLNLHPEPVA